MSGHQEESLSLISMSYLLHLPTAVIVIILQYLDASVTEFRQPLQVQSHLEMPRILVQLGHIQRT